jgi:hypothetical protein
LALVVAGVVALDVVGRGAVEHPDEATPSSGQAECGVERWTVTTLQDRPILIPAQPTTIVFLTSRPAPASLPDTRLPFERHIFTVIVKVC